MNKYYYRNNVIEAIQYNGENEALIRSFLPSIFHYSAKDIDRGTWFVKERGNYYSMSDKDFNYHYYKEDSVREFSIEGNFKGSIKAYVAIEDRDWCVNWDESLENGFKEFLAELYESTEVRVIDANKPNPIDELKDYAKTLKNGRIKDTINILISNHELEFNKKKDKK